METGYIASPAALKARNSLGFSGSTLGAQLAQPEQAIYRGDEAATDRPEVSPIETRLQAIIRALGMLDEEVSRTAARIDPILRPSMPEPPGSTVAGQNAPGIPVSPSQVEQVLSQIEARVWNAGQRLSSIIDRVRL